jgi:rhamnose utilization protein RhaD (predicted bifunctional aldolase and dehydrogenase)/NAD(P)-dependent dehydrogenase (short-subunit alcohol dehydrogenase family)
MKSRWSDQEAATYAGDLGQRVYSSRLLGRDAALVLHGGGNTSVKVREPNIFGEPEDVLYVKGSGWDLETIEAAGFAPCRLPHLLRLAELPQLSDLQMAKELKVCLTNPSAPMPSVEAILHALLPGKFVDHTHADALIAVTNTPGGEQRVAEIFGDQVVVIPYVMPGFKLARLCAERYAQQAQAGTIGLVLMNHGLFTFGDTAKVAYERMIGLVTRAENYLAKHGALELPLPPVMPLAPVLRGKIAALRREWSAAMGAPAILAVHADAPALGFAQRADVAVISQQGPATPDHVIRTKRLPLVGRDLAAYGTAYTAYFQELAAKSGQKLTMLDPAPRVLLDPELGLITAGRSAKEAAIASDIYHHTMEIIQRATALGGWRALPPRDIFDVEYWDLEQAKLRAAGQPAAFAGEIALVTGAASGIGKACVDSLLKRGAAVVGLDINPAITQLYTRPDFRGIVCDLTNPAGIAAALEETVRTFGGLDLLVLNAGIFPPGAAIADLGEELWRRVMTINLDANFLMMREAHPLLKLAPNGGRVVVIGSKNVPAPGPGAAAYSASKAAVNQLARVAALEWGKDGIRINSLHPNMVFDTALWTPEILASRAKHYGLSVAEYKTNNVLKIEVTSRDVAELAAEMCGPLFAKTTAAQVPVDGGNDRVI